MNRILKHMTLSLAAAAILAGCSTTKRLGQDEKLYIGVKKIRIEADSGVVVTGDAESAVKEPLSVKPNNPLYSPYVRTPLPIGLWAYNYFYTPKEKGFKYWFYKKLAKDPVLISKVQPELRVQLVNSILENHGYFGSQSTYTLLPRRHNPKKVKISYDVRVGDPYTFRSIAYPSPSSGIGAVIDSLRGGSLLRVGQQYNFDTLSAERKRITDIVRNKGYYYFRPEYLEYQADTTIGNGQIDLRMQLKPSLPEPVIKPYVTGDITIRLQSLKPGPEDTIRLKRYTVIYQKPLKIRPRLLGRSITLRKGDLFTTDAQNTSLTSLTKLGIFRSVNLEVTPPDSLYGRDTVNVDIQAAFDYPLSAELEVDVTSKSNSFVGPGLTLKLSNKNLFRGGEVLSLSLNGAYEWQTGNRNSGNSKSSLLNSYEFGLDATLDIPRLLAPGYFRFRKRTKYPARTTFQIGTNLMNRPRFFKIISFSGSVGYSFQTSPHSYHSLSILKFTYNNLLHTSAEFDRTMEENPAIALSFRNQFIPAASYTYTYDRMFGRNRLVWQNTLTTAGNLLYGIMELAGKHDTKQIFGNRFSQFVKGISEVKFYQKIGRKNMLAYRFMVGAAQPYGNSEVVPYSEQFYIGGANSIRAFTIRSLGPGSYRPANQDRNSYLDQTGTFKLEANVEFRFPIMGRLGGAVFLDAGNIWLLKDDPKRPGGVLSLKGFGNDIALGTGVGLRYDISILVLRLDMGIGIHTPYPNPDRHSYYNISSFKDGMGLHIAIGYPF